MLTVVGTGYAIAGQVTAEAEACMRQSDKLFYLVPDAITPFWLKSINPNAESLHEAYRAGRRRKLAYEEMVQTILKPVRLGWNVCAAFYGHPGVLCAPGHEAVRQARAEGFQAIMLPGISAQDCLFADLQVEPSRGLQTYEATDFVENRRQHDPRCILILWQIGAIGVTTFKQTNLWNRTGLQRLTGRLLRSYSPYHEVVLYETSPFPTCDPVIERQALAELPQARVTIASTLYVPPK